MLWFFWPTGLSFERSERSQAKSKRTGWRSSVVPGIDKLSDNSIADEIPRVFERAYKPDMFLKNLKERPNSNYGLRQISKDNEYSEYDNAKKIVNGILKYCICFIAKCSDYRIVFSPPLTGSQAISGKNDNPPLSTVTTYVSNLLTTKVASDVKKDKDLVDNDLKTIDKKELKIIASMCLLIIWRHLDRWSGENVDFHVSTLRSQAKMFAGSQFTKEGNDEKLDVTILNKIIAFASDK